jgi:gas vesicle protein
MSRRGETRRRTSGREYEPDWLQNAEEVMDNVQRWMNVHIDRSNTVLKHIQRMTNQLMDKLQNNMSEVSEERKSQLSDDRGNGPEPVGGHDLTQNRRNGNNGATICDGGTTSSSSVPHAAGRSNGRTDGQSEMCPICLCGFVTQEVGTPEACNHSFCADCLLKWLKSHNTCPLDRQVCDTFLVRRWLGGKVVRKIHIQRPKQQ